MKRVTRSYFLPASALAALAAAGLAGCNAQKSDGTGDTASASPSATGTPGSGDVPLVCTQCLKDEKYVGQRVTIEGEVVQQCPAKGCWFRIKDDIGEGFIDLSPANLTVQGERVGQHAKVTGKVVKKGGQMRIEAEHVEFSPVKKDPPPAGK